MISILLPTRARPRFFNVAVASIAKTIESPYELLVYVDDDDESYKQFVIPECRHRTRHIIMHGSRLPPPKMINLMAAQATGDTLVPFCDDAIMRTPGWDQILYENLPEDGIYVAYPDDGYNHQCTFPIISKRWLDVIGHFMPPILDRWYSDEWLIDVAERIYTKRAMYFASILFDHIHPYAGKRKGDETFNHQFGDNGRYVKQDKATYEDNEDMRPKEAMLLRAAIGTYWRNRKPEGKA